MWVSRFRIGFHVQRRINVVTAQPFQRLTVCRRRCDPQRFVIRHHKLAIVVVMAVDKGIKPPFLQLFRHIKRNVNVYIIHFQYYIQQKKSAIKKTAYGCTG